jgi:UDP-2-acetamido-3-amino-2,3-dideoxy-glucuronate N-acetyltransferase
VNARIYVHPSAIVETDSIGAGSRIWAFTHIMRGARVGADANIGDHCFIETGSALGDNVTIKNGCMIWEGVTIEDGVFVGPGVCFTNDRRPRSRRLGVVRTRYADKSNWLLPTLIKRGATIGARATIIAGTTIGAFAMVAAGAVVTRDVQGYALVRGNPARHTGWICECGMALNFENDAPEVVCVECERRYRNRDGLVVRPE